MSLQLDRSGRDPRHDLGAEDMRAASLRSAPQVGRAATGVDMGMLAGVIGALGLGAFTLFAMSGEKRPAPAPASPVVAPTGGRLVEVATAPPAPASSTVTAPSAAPDADPSRSNPLIVDNTDDGGGAKSSAAAGPVGSLTPQALTDDEQFSLRIGGEGGAAHAQALTDPVNTVVQGSIIPAVLETGLNSDLPGYARAIVSGDVRGFDGSKVMVPRGSRLIGQYKSGLATGQSRAFIIWTRLIRPDGVSIQLGSPVMDEAGQTGLGGKVNRHFLQRFGSAMLLSVVGGLAGVVSDSGANALVINTGSEAQGAAAQALQADARIAPTVKVPVGTPIQVFVARDLDFSDRPGG